MKKGQHRHFVRKQGGLHKQRGIAAIWMGLSLAPLLGFAFWAVEGTRYVQESSRLKDATEAAVMSVTIADPQDNSDQMAEGYVNAYVRDIDANHFDIVRVHQDRNAELKIAESITYTINSTTTHKSWFANNFIPSFNEQQKLTGKSTAKKHINLLGERNVDIVFVSDFSGSMGNWISGKQKIRYLKSAITEISEMLLCSSIDNITNEGVCSDDLEDITDKLDNRIAFVPYNIRTREQLNNKNYVTTQLRYQQDYRPDVSSKNYETVRWNEWAKYSYSQLYKIASCPDSSDHNLNCDEYKNYEIEQVQRLIDVLKNNLPHTVNNNKVIERYRSNYDTYNYVDFPRSVQDMMVNKFLESGNRTAFNVESNSLFLGWGSSGDAFWNIELTNNLEKIEDIEEMTQGGNTAAFQGILRGVQLLNAGNPNSNNEEEQEAYNEKAKIMLILSDGQEYPDNDVLKGLVDAGMCDTAREKIPGLYIGILGIGFNADSQSGFQHCVLNPEEDIINVDNLDNLMDKIEQLIARGAKASSVPKLY